MTENTLVGLPSRLIGIADADTLGDALVERVLLAAKGGLTWVLFRTKGWETAKRVETARELAARLPKVTISMHGDLQAMEEAGCGGLHFPSGPLAVFRGGVEADRLVGVSCHDGGETAQAVRDGADYLLLSPLFAPTSKKAAGVLLGVEGFAEIASRCKVPVFALGGMTPERVGEVAQAGASGVAVLGDLFLADDVQTRARVWVEAVDDNFKR